ncbi:hypothetical protein [Neobacillus soli]|uniref:hypothetical protein n=1 Tax=Neobacillus soli TaxID=220688 RepID=UPI000AEFE9AD|nr:hypothetical protein [Neobacillus soli]
MTYEEGKLLREAWKENGNQPCNHDFIDREYMYGGAHSDYICTTCGECHFNKEEFHKDK